MKALPWILAGVAVGVCVTVFLRLTEREMEPETESATGSDAVERVAPKRYGWGTKTLIGGRGGSVKGTLEESAGRVGR